MRRACILLTLAMFALVACTGSEETRPNNASTQRPPETTASGNNTVAPVDAPPGVQGKPISSRPAAGDAHGSWTHFETNGVTVEIPTGANWRVQFVLDPCHGDQRYMVLLEELETGERIRVDLVGPRVTSIGGASSRLDSMRERILGSVRGVHTPPEAIRTFGPNPITGSCQPGDESVPTLVPDTFKPPSDPAP